jgi:hypothetical protein
MNCFQPNEKREAEHMNLQRLSSLILVLAMVPLRSVIVLSRCDRCCRDEREGRDNGEKKVRTRLAILHVSPKTLHARVMKELVPARSAT